MASEQQQTVLDIPVEYGGVSIGAATARIGIKIDREVLNIVAADDIFCGHRLSGRLIKGRNGDSPGQQTLMDDADDFLDAIFDVKNMSVTADKIGTGFTFCRADVDTNTLSNMAKGSGRILIRDVRDIPDDEKPTTTRSEPPGALKSEGPWATFPLSKLFDGPLLKSLQNAGLNTVGELASYTKADKQLTDLKGVGPGKAEKIEARMIQFWQDNPDSGMSDVESSQQDLLDDSELQHAE